MSEKKNTARMALRLPTYVREEVSRTADLMDITDSNFVRIAISLALAKFAKRFEVGA
jgi:hypothetical protein